MNVIQKFVSQALRTMADRRRRRMLLSVLAVVVVVGVGWTLRLSGIALNGKVICGLDEHTHSESCYTQEQSRLPLCTYDSLGVHEHSEECRDEEDNLICGMADFLVHTHTPMCMDESRVLRCLLPQIEAHTHNELCYTAVQVEADHVHGDSCYGPGEGQELICQEAEYAGHAHGAECYTAQNTRQCGLQETPGHTHHDGCLTIYEEPQCGQDLPHTHHSGCDTRYDTPQCGLEEGETHTHTDSCFILRTCGMEETPGHAHTDSCYQVRTCGMEECGPHTHSDDCFLTLTCQEPETPGHTHGDGCYTAARGDLICTIVATQEEADAARTLTCGQEEIKLHTHDEKECYEYPLICAQSHDHTDQCYDTVLICKEPELLEHNHGVACFPQVDLLTCGQQEHTHTGECTPTEPEVVRTAFCGYQEHTHTEGCSHTHTDQCYEWVTPEASPCEITDEGHTHDDTCTPKEKGQLICTTEEGAFGCALEEHRHTLSCTADLSADVETQESWDAMFAQLDLSGIWTDDVLTVAKTQLGYTPSTRNFKVAEDGFTLSPYTRYGAWTGDPYRAWDELFVSFVLHYAGISDTQVPYSSDAASWVGTMTAAGYWRTMEVLPEPGDILFLDHDGDGTADRAAFLEAIETNGEESAIQAIEAADSGVLRTEYTYKAEDALILGYADLSAAQDFAKKNQEELEDPLTHKVTLYADPDRTVLRDDPITITLHGQLPEGAQVVGWPVNADLTDIHILAAYDLSILLEDGTVFQPQEPVTVTFSPEALSGAAENAELAVWYVPEEGIVEQIQVTQDEQGVSFPAAHFSVYALVDVHPLQSVAEPGGDPMIDEAWVHFWEAFAGPTVPLEVQEAQLFASNFAFMQPFSFSQTQEQIVSEGGDVTAESKGVYISKTISATEIENVFDITLHVATNTSIETLTRDPDMAVVIVMDISNTMNATFGNTTRYLAAVEAADQFLDSFYKVESSLSRVGFVAFNTDAHEVFPLSQCKDEKQAASLKSAIRSGTSYIVGASDYGDTHNRFTNIEGGLKRAYDMLKYAENENKYIIFLSDGFPTTYLQSGYTGWDPYYEGNSSVHGDGVFWDEVTGYYCRYGTSYSDEAAIRARRMATDIKNKGTKIFSIGIDVGGQTINGYDGRSGLSVIDRTSRSYELGSATDTNAFKNWLRNSIGSGYYYDSTNTAGLNQAYAQIFTEIQKFNQENSYDKWVANDPMPMAGDGASSFIEFLGFYDHMGMGDYQVYPPTGALTGSHTENGENTASYDASAHAIRWDLKNSGYISLGTETQYSYNYWLRYRVRLKNELAGFAEPTVYQTNGRTTLTYQEVTTVDGVPSFGDVKQLDFPYPSVKGYLGELTFRKVDSSESHAPVVGAEFTLTHSDFCSLCRGDGLSAVPLNPMKALSDENGIVTFTGIPSGHLYDLEETRVPAGYFRDDSTYTVLVSYDDVTVTHYYPNPNAAAQDGADKFLTNVWTKNDDGVPALAEDGKIINFFSYTLPETGGTGVLLYLMGGLLLTAAPLKYAHDQKKRGRRHRR